MIDPAPGSSGRPPRSRPVPARPNPAGSGRPGRRRRAGRHGLRGWPGPARLRVQPPSASGRTRDAVPIPPLNSWQIIPVPPPTLPSATGPAAADVVRGRHVLGPDVRALDVVQHAVVSLADHRHRPVQGAPAVLALPSALSMAASASRTTPTLWVLVMATGVVSKPDSAIQAMPVSSPLPLSVWTPRRAGALADVAGNWPDHGDAGTHRSAARVQRSGAADQRRVADQRRRPRR